LTNIPIWSYYWKSILPNTL